MWIVNFLPDWIFHLITIASLLGLAASFVLSSVPFIGDNAKAIQAGCGILLVIGVFFEGAISDNNAWQTRVKELELRIARAETASAEANGKLSKALADKEKVIAQAQAELKNRVRESAAAMDAVCKIPANVVDILNDAAKKGAKK